jgi:AcrR family transcriptional regulator
MKRSTVEARRAEILETTCQVVIERGFAATRVSDVANRLGVSTGLIHYHFESKDQLLAEAFRHAAASDLARLATEVDRDGPAVERLDRLFSLDLPPPAESGAAERGWVLWIDGWGEALRNPELKRISQQLDLQWKGGVEEVIRQGVKAGEFTVHDQTVSRDQLVDWVRAAACLELGLPAGTFAPRRGRRRSG